MLKEYIEGHIFKNYVKANMIGDNSTTIVAKAGSWMSNFVPPEYYYHYRLGKDIITGEKLIFIDSSKDDENDKEKTFYSFEDYRDKIRDYGKDGMKYPCAINVEYIDDEEVLEILKGMTEKEITRYVQAIENAKEQQEAWLEENKNSWIEQVRETIDEKSEMISQKARVKKLAKENSNTQIS